MPNKGETDELGIIQELCRLQRSEDIEDVFKLFTSRLIDFKLKYGHTKVGNGTITKTVPT
jgi:hypothetical protein